MTQKVIDVKKRRACVKSDSRGNAIKAKIDGN